ncbi:outer-membrane lipoprotein carrier protein LolA [Pelagibacterales bacterium SAG-MED39]|nr:outer-membrane lipoprotein carrier protein LolA [Pelagibacterales bacterium SAG-MED39]
MFYKFLILFILIFFHSPSKSIATIKQDIINNLKSTKNISFDFEQNINGKIETGNCILEYPKKIFCKYENKNKKILVSNGQSLVIKTNNPSYYHYPLNKTPLNLILDKNFLLNEIAFLKERSLNENYINYTILKNDNEINIFFDKRNFFLIGWQVVDIYQNLNITFLSSIKKNQLINKNLFLIPSQD